MTAITTSTPRYEYKKWQLAALSILIPAAYGAVTLSTLIESLAAAFMSNIPESASGLFLILLIFTLFRYGLIGAAAGYLRAGQRRGNLWLATGGGTIAGLILFFVSNLFL
ncbi:MAG: hypothetical protein ACE5FD_18250, partial [Anaerolineae bacterium]